MPLRGKAKRFADTEKSDAWVIPEGGLGMDVNGRAAIVAGKPNKSVWTCEKEGALTIRSCRTGSLVRTIMRKHIFPWSLAEGPLGKYVWVGYSDGAVILFSSSPPHDQVKVLQVGGLGGCYCVVPHLNWMFAGYGNSQIFKWNGLTLERDGFYVGHQSGQGSAIRDICLNNADLYTCGDDATIRKWDVVSCEETSVFKGHTAAILSITYTRKNHLWSTGEDSTVKVWDPKTQKCLKTHKLESPSSVLRFMGNRVWCGCWKKTIVIFDAVTLERVGHYHNHKAPIAEVLTVSASRLYKVWTYGIDRVVNVWTMEGDDSEYDQERRAAELRMFDLEAENRRLLKDLQAALEDAGNAHKITPSELLDARREADELRYQLGAQQDENSQLKALIRERNRAMCSAFVNRGLTVVQDFLRRYYYKLMVYAQDRARHYLNRSRTDAERDAAERERRYDKLLQDHAVLKSRFPQALQARANKALLARYWAMWETFANKRKLGKAVRNANRRACNILFGRSEADLRRAYFDKLAAWRRQRHERKALDAERAKMAADMDRQKMREAALRTKVTENQKEMLRMAILRMAAGLSRELMRRYYTKWRTFQALRFAAMRYRDQLDESARRLKDYERKVDDVRRNLKLRMRRRQEKVAGYLADRAQQDLLARYYLRWCASVAVKKAQGLAVRMLAERSRNALLNKYFLKLFMYSAARHREKADARVRTQGDLIRELRDLKARMADLEKDLADARAAAAQLQLDSELWEAKFRNAEMEVAAMKDQIDDVRAQYNSLQDKMLHQAKHLRDRPFHLAAACEVFKAIAEAIEAVELHTQDVDRRELGKVQLLNALTGIRKRAVKAKQRQIDCILTWFSEEERLSGNVNTLIYGHRHDVSCKKCGPAACTHRSKSVSATLRQPPQKGQGLLSPNSARGYPSPPSAGNSPRGAQNRSASTRSSSSRSPHPNPNTPPLPLHREIMRTPRRSN